MRTDRFRWLALLAALLLALTLVACGGDDDDDDAASDTEDTSGDTADDGGGDVDITIAGSAFSVAGPVAAGEPVAITNEDFFTHTVTADDGAFDVEVPGAEDASIEEDLEPGTYAFHCEIHPSMTGELVVE